MIKKAFWVSATALSVIAIVHDGAAGAATVPTPAGPQVTAQQAARQVPLGAKAAPKRQKKAAPSDKAADSEAINVTRAVHAGGGQYRLQTAAESRNSISQEFIRRQAAAASPLQLVQSLPGVNYGSSDAFSLQNRQNMVVRGLTLTELGYTFEGMPVIDQGYYQPYMETWTDNENIADITLLQGNSRIYDPVSTASGGELIETVRDPSDKMGGHLSYAAGSYRGQRVFARYDSGMIGNTGIKLFGSYSYVAANNFAGSGRSHRSQVDFKALKQWGDVGTSSLYVSYDNWYDARPNTISLAAWEKDNAVGNNFSSSNYAGTYVPSVTTNYWKPYVYKNQDVLVSFQNHFDLTNRLKLSVTPYLRWAQTDAPGQSSLSAAKLHEGSELVSIDTSDIYMTNPKTQTFAAMVNANQNMYSTGLNTTVNYDITRTNQLIFGYWFEHWGMDDLAGITPMDQYGNTPNDGGGYVLHAADGSVIAGTNFHEQYNIHQFYVSDQQSFLNDRLKLSAGFKMMVYNLSGTNHLPGSQGNFSSSFTQPMPRLSLSYDVNHHIQVYANAITNVRAPMPANSYVNTYNLSTGAVTQNGVSNVAPEYSISEELGFRYHGLFDFNTALFNINLTNHQVSTLSNVNGSLVVQALSVGGETIRGATTEIALHPIYGLSPYANGQYLHATQDNNFRDGNDYLPTQGKTMVASPRFMANVGMHYIHGPFYADLAFKWVDSQYSTFMNDQSMPAYKTVDLGLGYRLPNLSRLRNTYLRLNFNNLTNVKYLGAIASFTGAAHTMTGVRGTTLAGSQPGYYLAAPLAVMFSVSSDF
jgi:iron complex outermembrane recepter protein